ncbi:hypothetical protein CPAV1605_1406 [seawater metagenome]|uniref:ATPase AAA-type core domain-containing protein n=1 Tax=seawater metagenome TaxID=1561972 RepID=A0A5E8CJR3_9ZZZZ
MGGENVSGGQKQIISLMRAIIISKPIILLDEPTASLDSKHRLIVYKLIQKMKEQGKTIIISTHDPDLINLGDNIIRLDKGKIVK